MLMGKAIYFLEDALFPLEDLLGVTTSQGDMTEKTISHGSVDSWHARNHKKSGDAMSTITGAATITKKRQALIA